MLNLVVRKVTARLKRLMQIRGLNQSDERNSSIKYFMNKQKVAFTYISTRDIKFVISENSKS
jgi:hypothetical protein